MKNRDNIIYYVATSLFTILMLFSAGMYIIKNDVAQEAFTNLGIPVFIIYPLALVKLLGLTAIWTNKSKMLKEWAYSGFFFQTLLGIGVHLNIGDGEHFPILFANILIIISYVFYRKQTTVYSA